MASSRIAISKTAGDVAHARQTTEPSLASQTFSSDGGPNGGFTSTPLAIDAMSSRTIATAA
jgi:hypothetical protein